MTLAKLVELAYAGLQYEQDPKLINRYSWDLYNFSTNWPDLGCQNLEDLDLKIRPEL